MIRMWKSNGLTNVPSYLVKNKDELKKKKKPWKTNRIPGAFRLSGEDMDYLTRNTHLNEIEINNWYKGFMKDCPDGILSREKATQFCEQILASGDAEAFVNQIFRIFDKDGNGSIDFKEFMLAIDMTKAAEPEEKLRWAFKLYDMDNSGSIDMGEMVQAVETLYAMQGIERSDQSIHRKASQLFHALDIDRSGEISVDEFVKGCLVDQDVIRKRTLKA